MGAQWELNEKAYARAREVYWRVTLSETLDVGGGNSAPSETQEAFKQFGKRQIILCTVFHFVDIVE